MAAILCTPPCHNCLNHTISDLQGPLYVDVDHEPRATFSTFKKRFSGRKRKPPVALPNTTTTAAAATTSTAEGTIEYSTIQREQPHKVEQV